MIKSELSSRMRHQLADSTARLIQQDIVKSDLQIKALVQDIRECSSPSVDELNELNALVSKHMRVMKRSIEELEQLAREQDKEHDREELMKEAEQQQKQYASNQFALRKSNLSCQALLDKRNKEELFERSSSPQVKQRRGRADKESLVKQSSSVTDNLRAITGMMAAQVKQSEESLHALVGSSSVVTETHEEFKVMGGVIHQSKTLLQKYGRREVTDKVLIALALVFFIACVIYIVQKRLF